MWDMQSFGFQQVLLLSSSALEQKLWGRMTIAQEENDKDELVKLLPCSSLPKQKGGSQPRGQEEGPFGAENKKGLLKTAQKKKKILINSRTQILQEDHSHNFVALLKHCADQKDLERGSKLHAEVARNGLLKTNFFVGSTVISMYARCGLLEQAQKVFDELPAKNVVSWNALIAGYSQQGCAEKALECYRKMQVEGACPTGVTFVCILKACGSIGDIDMGREVHADIINEGFLKLNLFVGNALIDMYCKCGSMVQAKNVFNSLPVRDTVSWNALIGGFAQRGYGRVALDHFEWMQLEGVPPDVVTYVCSLKACGILGAIDIVQEVHAEISRKGLLEKDLFLGNALVDMYAKCGWLAKAQEIFDKLPVRDIVSWNVLMTGYVQHGYCEEAVNCFDQMQVEIVCPNEVTFASTLRACGSLGAIDKGLEIHAEVIKGGLLGKDGFLENVLVDMYVKCGLLIQAQEMFDKFPVRDAVIWNTLIAGYAQLGQMERVFCTLDKMIKDGVQPDPITCSSILTAFCHTGLVDKGQVYFDSMNKEYGIIPTLEHHTCMVDLLGRAGQLDKALFMIKKMPISGDLVVWLTLLGACRKWGHVELAKYAFSQALQLDDKDPAAYVCMSNIFSEAGMQDAANMVQSLRAKKQDLEDSRDCWSME